MKIFVTGATGYIGQRLVSVLANRQHFLHVLVRDIHSPNIPRLPNVKVFEGDITNKASIDLAVAGCERVFHAAGFTRLSAKDPSIFFKVNVDGTRNVLESSLQHGVKRLVFTSSGGVFGPSLKNPMSENDPRIISFESDYDLTKHLAEELVREYVHKGLYGVIVNPTRVYGPGLNTYTNAINRFISWILFKRFVIVPAIGNVESNYSYIDDVIEGHLLAIEKGIAGERYILGGENIAFKTLVGMVLAESGRKNNLIELPVKMVQIASGIRNIAARFIGTPTDLTPKILSRLLKNRTLSSNKAIRQLGYRVTPLHSGIRETIQFLNQQSHE
jgi:nucleoside-diphosphate-sugar epimerase